MTEDEKPNQYIPRDVIKNYRPGFSVLRDFQYKNNPTRKLGLMTFLG